VKLDLNYGLNFSNKSIEDLTDIFQFSEEPFGSIVTDKYRKGLNLAFEKITKMPTAGSKRLDISNEYRSLIYKSHIIFYKINEDRKVIFIHRVLHLKMDFKIHL
jgi:toxin ParE1/3/4